MKVNKSLIFGEVKRFYIIYIGVNNHRFYIFNKWKFKKLFIVNGVFLLDDIVLLFLLMKHGLLLEREGTMGYLLH